MDTAIERSQRPMAPRHFACFGRGGGASSSSASPEANAMADLTAEEQRLIGPVLVELFSSQGCGTSTEAEIVVSRLGRGELLPVASVTGEEGQVTTDSTPEAPPVAVMAFHVEYWDYRGWKDPLARFEKSSAHLLQVSFSGSLRSKVDSKGADVMVALYESGLLTDDVDKGENKGRVLNNDYVVRCMEKLISVKDASARKKISGTVNFSLWDGFSSIKCDLLHFVQNNSLQTFGVQHFKIPHSI